MQVAARTLGVQILPFEMRDGSELDAALRAATASAVDAMVAVSSRMTVRHRGAMIDFATKNRLPLAGGWGLWAESGGLLSYGPDLGVMARLVQ